MGEAPTTTEVRPTPETAADVTSNYLAQRQHETNTILDRFPVVKKLVAGLTALFHR